MATQKEVAEHLDLSDRMVRNLIQDSILPASKGRGGLNLDACRNAYIRHLRGIASGQAKASEEELELNQERAALAAEQRRKLKRENDLAEGLVAPVETITSALADVAAQIVPILEALPLEMKRLNPKLSGHDIQTVKKAIARCRNTIADINISEGRE